MTAAATAVGATYARYADDLVLSGGAEFARRTNRFIPLAAAIVIDEGFSVQFRKTRVMGRAQRQEVCGIVVNERPNLRRPAYDRLEAILTNCVRHGPSTQSQAPNQLRGYVAWVEAVSPHRAAKLRALYDRIDWSR